MRSVSEWLDEDKDEDRSLDYKVKQKILNDPKKVIKNNVAAMANNEGGTIVVGVDENEGKIESIQDIDSSEINRLRQKISDGSRSKLSPAPRIDFTTITYDGSRFSSGSQLLLIDIEKSEKPISYQKRDFSLFPYRYNSQTGYMDGNQIYDFIRSGIRPGSRRRSSEESGNNEKDEDKTNTVLDNTTPNYGKFQGYESKYDSEEFFTSSNDTGGGAINLWNFHHIGVTFHEPVTTTSHKGRRRIEDLEDILKAAKEYLGANLRDGSYSIGQRKYQWFGKSAENFIYALKHQGERYSEVENDADFHSSEAAQFICRTANGTMVINCQPTLDFSREKRTLPHFVVGFAFEDIVIDNREILKFLEQTDLNLRDAKKVENPNNKVLRRIDWEELDLEVIERLKVNENDVNSDPWIGALICKNPFYKNSEMFEKFIEDSEYENLTKLKKIFVELRDHHPATENKDYTLTDIEINNTGGLTGGFLSRNAWFMGTYKE